MKIYTKTGDSGETGLFSGKRVRKDSSYIEAYGTVDEFNAFLGWAATASSDSEISKELAQIQHELHSVCADLATPMEAKGKVERISNDLAPRLEKLIDRFEAELEPLRNFILAGGSELASRLHIARTVGRRAERSVIHHASLEKINSEVVVYLNRLSDLLFVMARVANKRAKIADIAWTK